jgi:hypothetical protein
MRRQPIISTVEAGMTCRIGVKCDWSRNRVEQKKVATKYWFGDSLIPQHSIFVVALSIDANRAVLSLRRKLRK